MPVRKVTDEQIDRMIKMREAGRSTGTIARIVGVSPGTVDYHCIRLGVVDPNRHHLAPGRRAFMRNGFPVRPFTLADDIEIQRLSREQVPVSDIARRVGRRPHSVQHRLYMLAMREDA